MNHCTGSQLGLFQTAINVLQVYKTSCLIDNFLLPFFSFCKPYILNILLCSNPLVLLLFSSYFYVIVLFYFQGNFSNLSSNPNSEVFCFYHIFYLFLLLSSGFCNLLLLFHRFRDNLLLNCLLFQVAPPAVSFPDWYDAVNTRGLVCPRGIVESERSALVLVSRCALPLRCAW